MVSFKISIQALIMKIAIITQIYHSIHIWKNMLIRAATRVDNDIKQSFNASIQLAVKLHEFSFFHSFLKYFPKKNFAKIAIVTTIRVITV
jgi:hypothetical protein